MCQDMQPKQAMCMRRMFSAAMKLSDQHACLANSSADLISDEVMIHEENLADCNYGQAFVSPNEHFPEGPSVTIQMPVIKA